MKKLIVFTISLLALTACTVTKVDDYSYEEVVNNVLLAKDTPVATEHFEGYKYYRPHGVIILDKNDLNTALLYEGESLFMYNDTLAYYYEEESDYLIDKNLFYTKAFNEGDKKGYLEIDKQADYYYFNYMYNYSKIEGACHERKIKDCLNVSSLILSSVEYNDTIIASLISENIVTYEEKVFDVFKKKTSSSMTLNFTGEAALGVTDDNTGLVEEDFVQRTEDFD